MRAFYFPLMALTVAGCATPSDKTARLALNIELTYDLSLWRVDESRRPVGGQRVADAKFDQMPSIQDQRELLRLARSPELQIISRCYVNGAKLACHDLGTSPESAELVSRSRLFLSRFRIGVPSLNQMNPHANYGFIQMRIALPGTELGASGRCLLVSQCGIPIPPPPPPPKLKPQ